MNCEMPLHVGMVIRREKLSDATDVKFHFWWLVTNSEILSAQEIPNIICPLSYRTLNLLWCNILKALSDPDGSLGLLHSLIRAFKAQRYRADAAC